MAKKKFPKGKVNCFPETDSKIVRGTIHLGEPTGQYIITDVWYDNLDRRCTTFIGTAFTEGHAIAICNALNKK